jgi:AcrR family transcriptional regulator
MATASSQAVIDRRSRVRARTIDEALDLAVEIMTEHGVGGLTMSELARRMGMQGPSLYKYFASVHDLYDALFARGLAATDGAVQRATADTAAGVETLRATARAIVRWSVENQALAQLLFWRVVPGFEPSPETFAASRDQMAVARQAFTDAVRSRQLRRAADSDDAVRLFTVVTAGLISQQLANEPDVAFDEGRFTVLTDTALDMLFATYTPDRRK